MKNEIKGTAEQHATLDRKYQEAMDRLHEQNFWGRLAILQLWGEEKAHLSKFGQSYPRMINIGYEK